jgi:hypothetical protein
LTTLFFSTLPNEYEKSFKEEIWGCFKYIGIPMETLMNMPIADRKYYIMLHNKTEKGSSEDDNEMMSNEEIEKINMMRQVKDWH